MASLNETSSSTTPKALFFHLVTQFKTAGQTKKKTYGKAKSRIVEHGPETQADEKASGDPAKREDFDDSDEGGESRGDAECTRESTTAISLSLSVRPVKAWIVKMKLR